MKILITGANGLLGQKIVYALKSRKGFEVIATARGVNRMKDQNGYIYASLDITDRDAVLKTVDEFHPDTIINTAAMTNVDTCEQDKDGCKKLNVDAVSYLLVAAEKNNSHLIHLSTDFVFDGENGPYSEEDTPSPQSYYAWSKLESEKILEEGNAAWTVIRTIIIYGVADDEQRSNVVLWTKKSLEQGKKINVITDQYRSPTLAEDLAEACISAAVKKAQGIYHVSGKELMSIIDIVNTVADFFHLDKSYINPVSSDQLNQPAKRPAKTGFILDKAIRELDYHPHSLPEGLQIISDQLEARVVK
ncbi:MAG: SDR family oxidoreductase [Bacteroidota bacterium]